MRTLKLTHKQIELLQLAFGIAEKSYSEIFKKVKKLSLVRGNLGNLEQEETAKFYHKMASDFADFNESLMNSEFDV